MIRILFFIMLTLSFSVTAEIQKDTQTGLKIAKDWQLIKNNCTSCHSAKIITMQQSTRNGWINIIRWMQDKQGLGEFDQKTENRILGYLAKNYPPVKITRRTHLPLAALPKNPFKTTNQTKNKKYKVIVLRKK